MPASTALPPNVIELRCLGPVLLTGRDRRTLPLRTRKQLGLLLYLARRPGRPVGRDELIELLWSADAERPARHSLSQSASLVNKSLGSEVVVTAGRDRLVAVPGAIWLDVTEFEQLAGDGRHQEALALWRGTLLEGTWVQRAPNFERWLHEERDRLQRIFRRIAHGRLEELRTGGNHATMRDEAERLLQLDPLDEKAMLVHLEALTLLDDRSLALRRFSEFEKRLRKELNAEPGSPLRTWAKRHRRGDGGAAARRQLPLLRVSEVMVLPTPQPLFGRTEEFALLWDGWEQAKVGRGSFIIIEGEAGIGKTALATKLVNQAHVAGGSVCFVKCYRTEKSVPFAPVTALIRQLCRLPGFVGLDPVWIGELTRLVPELRDRYPNAPTPMAVDDAARHRLSDATVQAALAVADELPLMIVIDDLQDADEASLAVLHYAARQLRQQSVLLIGLRRVGQETSDFLRAFFESISALNVGKNVKLPGLPSPDLERLVRHVFAGNGRSVHEDRLARIVADSTGNALQAIEAAVSSVLGGSTPDAATQFETTAGERIEDLSPEALDVAGAIVIAGRPLTQYELSSVTHLPLAELARAIVEVETQQLGRRLGDRLGLAHDRYSQTIEARLPSDKKRTLHTRTATMLQASAARDPGSHYQAAKHLLAAGRLAAAKQQAMEAARFALSLGAVRERATALNLAARSSEDFDVELAAELGACQLELREFEELESVCRAADREQLSAAQQADFTYLRIASDYFAGRQGHPALLAQLQQLVSAQPSFRFCIAARTLLMRLAWRSGNQSLGLQSARELRRILRSSGDRNNGHAFLALAYVASKHYSPARAISLLHLALERAKANNDLALEHTCRTGLSSVYRQSGQYARAVSEAELATAFARRTFNAQLEASSMTDAASAEMARGNYDKSGHLLTAATVLLRDHPDPSGLALAFANLGELYLVSGHGIEDAEHAFDKALTLARPLQVMMAQLQAAGGMAVCAQRRGRNADLSRWCNVLQSLGQGRERGFHDRWLTEAALAWDIALNGAGIDNADAELRTAMHDLRRRDVDHWLALALERLRLAERFQGRIDPAQYAVVKRTANQFGAMGTLRALAALGPPKK